MRCLLLPLLLFYTPLLAQWCPNNLLPNGEFNQNAGDDVVAWNWEGTETPDINSLFFPLQTNGGYEWTGTPLASSSGGTWQNLFDTVETVLTYAVLEPGMWYTLCFEYAAQGIYWDVYNLYYDQPVGVELWINGELALTTPDDTSQYTWELACHNFTVEQTTNSFMFRPTDYLYVAIDGACLIPEQAVTVPELTKDVIEVYPNPATETVTVKWPDIKHVSIFDMQGRKVYNQQTETADLVTIPIGDLQVGPYVLQVYSTGDIHKQELFVTK